MRIGVLSDSHDNVPKVEAAVDLFVAEGVGMVIHAGDFVAPFAVAPLARLECPVVAVFGNNDGERVGLARAFADIGEVHPNVAEAELHGRRIAVTHYPEVAEPLSLAGRHDLVVYGHTHRVDIQPRAGLLVNPGETGGWVTGRCTVALVDLDAMDVEIRELG
ncbi:MAG: metallophosphoesterase [Acidobacteriota bacterium]